MRECVPNHSKVISYSDTTRQAHSQSLLTAVSTTAFRCKLFKQSANVRGAFSWHSCSARKSEDDRTCRQFRRIPSRSDGHFSLVKHKNAKHYTWPKEAGLQCLSCKSIRKNNNRRITQAKFKNTHKNAHSTIDNIVAAVVSANFVPENPIKLRENAAHNTIYVWVSRVCPYVGFSCVPLHVSVLHSALKAPKTPCPTSLKLHRKNNNAC